MGHLSDFELNMQFSFCFLPSVFIYSLKFTFLLLPRFGWQKVCEREVTSFRLFYAFKQRTAATTLPFKFGGVSCRCHHHFFVIVAGCDVFCLHHTTPQCSYKTFLSLIFHQLIYRVCMRWQRELVKFSHIVDEMTQTNTRIHIIPTG